MANILLINGKKSFGHSKGALNQHLVNIANTQLTHLGHRVSITNVDEGYDIESEIDRWLNANVVIYQMPGWWMGPPWIIKKYLDEVLTAGHGKLYANDGRSRHDPSKQYGSGGLLPGKQYMFSVTWNAPVAAFDEPGNFFDGIGVDKVYIALHKAHEFLGMTKLPTFMCNDVIKDPHIEQDVLRYQKHLTTVLSTSHITESLKTNMQV